MPLSFDVDRLMAEIESRPPLWDRSNELFSNRNVSRGAWIDVARNIVPNFETSKYEKQMSYVEQLKRTYYTLRAAYRSDLKRGETPQQPGLSFLKKVFSQGSAQSTSNAASSAAADDTKGRPNSSADANRPSLSNRLKPVLSIRKIDAARVAPPSRKRGRPARLSSVPENVRESPPEPKPEIEPEPKPVIQQTPTVEEPAETGAAAKKCRYRYELQMASARENVPLVPTSTYASFSFEDDDQAERRMVPSRGHDSYDRSPSLDVCSRAELDGRYFGARRSPTIPFATAPLDYYDEDMAFFRSLLTWTRRFSEDEKLEFRSEVMRVVSRMRSESAANYYVLSQTPLS